MPRRRRSESHINAFRPPPPGEDYLYTVVTVGEAVRRWQRHHLTIRRAIDDRRLAARQSGTIWLISVESLIALWGLPISDHAYDE
jgi:hypothetical protein